MFDKNYFEKEFPKQLERYKKESKSETPEVVFVCGHNHLIVTEIEDLKEHWLSCWVDDGEFKSAGKSQVLMLTRYDKISQIIFHPLKGGQRMGFRTKK